ncbi:hypothetical protein CY34DRAFT_806381 [Suillus luteus UH-Slu-Lm8-n1]|uniref:Uncharacterized protein n=1 Tax=Suillus luteus UH-Slu-Lm8-n1 TaxID=930992 RepID=A0A0D0BCP6_9AGAM|nr:hypothetical protein CY34DRAFT_806381 [Suillus luteus UH-Slu-Lm8-n1]
MPSGKSDTSKRRMREIRLPVMVLVRSRYNASTACSSSREKCPHLTGACVPRLCAEALLHPRTTYYNQFSVRFAVLGARTRAVHESLYPVSHGI